MIVVRSMMDGKRIVGLASIGGQTATVIAGAVDAGGELTNVGELKVDDLVRQIGRTERGVERETSFQVSVGQFRDQFDHVAHRDGKMAVFGLTRQGCGIARQERPRRTADPSDVWWCLHAVTSGFRSRGDRGGDGGGGGQAVSNGRRARADCSVCPPES
jgi:hypothetical protein